jgi:hypothetical protein
MRTSVFVRVRKRQFITNRILLQKRERVTETDIVIRFGKQTGSDEVRTEHDKNEAAQESV